MAGITDLPFRRIVARFGAGLVVSEMVASQEIVQAKPAARDKAELGLDEAATSVQLAGRDPYWMAEAARLVEGQGARAIDINMGCPAKKVTSLSGAGACGAALLRDLDHALRVIEAVVAAVSVPVTLKTRLGWDGNTPTAVPLAQRAVAAGISLVTIHGRTRAQFYKGHADWAAIAPVVSAVDKPVIANGDVDGPAAARTALAASGAAGVMIGRAARGQPWLLSQIAAALAGQKPVAPPIGPALADLVAEHYEAMLGFYGADLGNRVARKHLGWYLDAAGDVSGLRRRLLTEREPANVLALLPDVFAQDSNAAQVAA